MHAFVANSAWHSQAWLSHVDSVVNKIRRRIAQLLKVPSGLAEPMQARPHALRANRPWESKGCCPYALARLWYQLNWSRAELSGGLLRRQVLRYERSQHYWSHHDYFDLQYAALRLQ